MLNTRRILAAANTAALLVVMAALTAHESAKAKIDRATNNDRGHGTLEWVIIAAGVCAVALVAVAWVKPVIQKYLGQIF